MNENIRSEVVDWYDAALIDLEEARSAFMNKRYNWALFATHQAVEKALKAAIMALKKKRPPKTHDLTRLLALTELKLERELEIGISELSPYYIIARYPNAGLERPWESISKETAQRLIEIAEKLVTKIGEIIGIKE